MSNVFCIFSIAKRLFNTFSLSIFDMVKSFIVLFFNVYFNSQDTLYLRQCFIYFMIKSFVLNEAHGYMHHNSKAFQQCVVLLLYSF